jgi:Uncharacterized membrane-associated protein/domain
MVEMPWGELPRPPPLAAHFLLARLSVDLFIDIADIVRDGRDLIDSLFLSAVIEANVAPINQDPALQQRYGALDTPPPDELRRPVSINAIAASLGQPFETTRRRINDLARRGECIIGPKGVIVPTARLMADDYLRVAQLRYERVRRLYFDLLELGGLAEMAAEASAAWPEADGQLTAQPVRLVNRLLSEYYLRALELLGRSIGDPLAGLVMMGLARLNLQALTPAQRTVNGFLPDELRRPVRRADLARSIGLPAETVRRRLLALEKLGYCRTGPEGVVFSLTAVAQPEAQKLFHDNNVNLLRMMSRLNRYGVLTYWDREALS